MVGRRLGVLRTGTDHRGADAVLRRPEAALEQSSGSSFEGANRAHAAGPGVDRRWSGPFIR